ncbi:hypothetical protein Dsin_028419 [Dipteronia sinensis]|uniref:Bromodomain associated domain-containing protein n=1 Tax=Dipteronia sinensis TaxID=43782 RepID=A0AAE0DU85_9ROSI|nr:hypothetical protein Dsin_028419 [Dipteronia sinensis]
MKQIIKTKSKRKQYQSIAEDEEEETPTEFSFKLTRVAVSQICRSMGFMAAQRSALETLTLITSKYLEEVAKLASSYSHESNRTQSNIFDLINALNDMSSPIQGFVGAATVHDSCLLSCGVLKEISGFVKCTDEIPFAKPIPRNYAATLSMSRLKRTVSKPNSMGLKSHIPRWLPAFPDAGTYKERKEMVCIRKTGHLWENSEFVQENESKYGGVVERILGGDLAVERGKVSFKFGVKAARNGL